LQPKGCLFSVSLKELADNVLNLSDDFLEELLKQGIYTEVPQDGAQNVQK
jgi:hypothetical protein